MKACSRNDFGPFLPAGITVALGVFFWFPLGPGKFTLTPHPNMAGKTWTLREDKPQTQMASTTAQLQAPTSAAPKVAEATLDGPKSKMTAGKLKKPRRHAGTAVSHVGNNLAGQSTAPKILASTDSPKQSGGPEPDANSIVAVRATVPPGTFDATQEISLQEVMDRFEADPSKYPLDRTVVVDGITLSLRGLQRRDASFVLKVALANATGSDFYIKDFTLQAGSTVIGSRSLFRILVEPHREREGYVIFEKPQAGAQVNVYLKEDGGKARALAALLPYRF